MKQRIIALTLVTALAVTAFTACGANTKSEEKADSIVSEEKADSIVSEETVAGGTENTLNENASLPEDLQKIFEEASGQFNGLTQQAVAYLGSQVVAGANHAFLTQDIDQNHDFHVLIAYVDLQGNVELKSVADVDPFAESYGETVDTAEAGGWTVAENTYSSVPAEAEESLKAAILQTTGISAGPVALLGTQVVAGTNYSILCKTAPVVPDATESFQVIHVYQDLSDNSEITEYVPFFIADFTE